MAAIRLLGMLLAALLAWGAGPGFRSERLLDDHYRKHGDEFGNVTKAEYLRLAQTLRDAPASQHVLEAKRPDGTASKFDRRNGHFVAYNPDRTIRTFFIPAAGESYFWRQAGKRHVRR